MSIEKPFKEGADFEHLKKVLMRETTDGPVPIIELVADFEIMSEVSGVENPIKSYKELFDIGDEPTPEQIAKGVKLMDLTIAFSDAVGYDYVTMLPIIPLKRTRAQFSENPQQGGKERGWQNEHAGLITSRDEFESFPWPSTERTSIAPIEYSAGKMSDGMKILCFAFGILEDLKVLMGFETMAIKSIEEPDLLDDILEKLTEIEVDAVDKCAAHPATGAIFFAEDMGFNSNLMLSPGWFREFVIPRHKRIAEACHKHGKPFLLHSCGQIDSLMEDLIEEVGIDGRHSYQDVIEPVEEVYKKYGDRISILGGLDVDLLSRGTGDEVRARTRQILEACAPGGGYCMGSGNSVTNFCKVENYYAMLDETRKWNEERGWA